MSVLLFRVFLEINRIWTKIILSNGCIFYITDHCAFSLWQRYQTWESPHKFCWRVEIVWFRIRSAYRCHRKRRYCLHGICCHTMVQITGIITWVRFFASVVISSTYYNLLKIPSLDRKLKSKERTCFVSVSIFLAHLYCLIRFGINIIIYTLDLYMCRLYRTCKMCICRWTCKVSKQLEEAFEV